MKLVVDGQLALSLVALISCCLCTIDAFIANPHPHKPGSISLATTNSVQAAFVSKYKSNNKHTISLYAADDDDDDDDYDDEDDEDEGGPLAKGVDSVAWLPSVAGSKGGDISSVKEGAEVLPLFPLGGFVYTPNTEHVLNIFEPRYRQMYTDILMNGSKRFVVVTSHPSEKGRFAQTGVLFELEDLKEVSEQTADQIKYICNHKVTGRVTIHQVLNPEAWESRETYLKCEGTILDDSKEPEPKDEKDSAALGDVYGAIVDAASAKEEVELIDSFTKLVDLQHDLEEDVRFTVAAKATLAVKDGPGEDGLWHTVRLWQTFVDQRLMARQNELQADFQKKLQDFLKKEKGLKDDEMPSAIGFQDLNESLQEEVQELQKRMSVELQPLLLESSSTMQKILEAEDHKARCTLLKFFMDAERKRLESKRTLQGIFSSSSTDAATTTTSAENKKGGDAATPDFPPEEMVSSADSLPTNLKSSESQEQTSSFFDDEDAFQ